MVRQEIIDRQNEIKKTPMLERIASMREMLAQAGDEAQELRHLPEWAAKEMAALAGMSDEAVRAKTGRTWSQWVRALDDVDAATMPHREIARHVRENYEGVSGWWAQTVAVGYERIRGLREIGQRRGGGYDANKSKTFAVPVSRLYRAFSVKRTRERWLADVELRIRTSTVDKSMRIT